MSSSVLPLLSRSSAARWPPLCCPPLSRQPPPRASTLTAVARPIRRYHSGCYNDNSTLCFGCVESHAASLAKANCSSFEEQEFCSSHHYHEVECEPPNPSDVHLEKRPPVILIPPLSGSFMDWKMVNRKQKHFVCKRNEDWIEFFPPTVAMAAPLLADCYFDDASLDYDPKTDIYSYPEGVEIRVNMTLESQCDVDPNPAKAAFTNNRTSFGCVCKNLQAMGYTRYQDLRVYPYDWRLGPGNWMAKGGFYEQLQAYIEKQYAESSNTPVTAIGFSLGSPVFALFLQQFVEPAWREKYISSFVSLSGTFGGTAETVLNQLQLGGEGGPPIPWALKPEFAAEQTYGSFSWMSAILPPTSLLATAGSTVRYTAAQLPVRSTPDWLLRKASADLADRAHSSVPAGDVRGGGLGARLAAAGRGREVLRLRADRRRDPRDLRTRLRHAQLLPLPAQAGRDGELLRAVPLRLPARGDGRGGGGRDPALHGGDGTRRRHGDAGVVGRGATGLGEETERADPLFGAEEPRARRHAKVAGRDGVPARGAGEHLEAHGVE